MTTEKVHTCVNASTSFLPLIKNLVSPHVNNVADRKEGGIIKRNQAHNCKHLCVTHERIFLLKAMAARTRSPISVAVMKTPAFQ